MRQIAILLGFVAAIVCSSAGAQSIKEKFKNYPTGLDPATLKQEMRNNPNRITEVKPNAMAIERKNSELKRKGKPLIDKSRAVKREEEITTVRDLSGGATATDVGGSATVMAVPGEVDNSKLDAFPPIWTQGSENSCFPFNVTYYLMSHETCLVRGCNNKSGDKTNIFSPRFIYNFVSQGTNSGCCQGRLFEVLSQHGAPNLNELPYNSGDYIRWDLNTQNWISALNNRMNNFAYVNVQTAAGQENAKQLLANGHIFMVGTYIYSFIYTTVGVNPSSANPYAGATAVSYLNGTAGGHAMTVVGYDDSLWIDVNANGSVDSGEIGAFRIANSWGTGYGNGGFIWVSYDAFKLTSAVSGMPSGRTQFTQDGNFWSSTSKGSYTPKILAKFTVNHQVRNQMSLSMGVSSTSSTTPTTNYTPAVMNYQGGPYTFDGGSVAVDGTFVFDFSDIVPAGSSSLNYYFKISDNSSGYPLTLKDFRLIDVGRNQEIPYSGALPVQADASTSSVKIGYSFSDGNFPPVAQLSGATSSSGSGATVSLDASGSYDPDGSITSYAWNFGDGTSQSGGSTATHAYSNPGSYTITLTVVDNKGASASATYSVVVQDAQAPSAPTNVSASLVVTSKGRGKAKQPTYGVKLTWSAASDNVGVVSYRIYRNNSLVGTSSSLSFTDGSTSVGSSYNYYVIAVDAAGNVSPASNVASINR